MRHRFFIDTQIEFRVTPGDFRELVRSMIASSDDFTVTRQKNTISGETCLLIVGGNLFIEDPNAE